MIAKDAGKPGTLRNGTEPEVIDEHADVDAGYALENWCYWYRIAGNFCEVQIFAIFATHDQNAKFEHVNFWKFLPHAFCASLARSDV